MLRESEGYGNAGVGDGGGVVAMSIECEYMGDKRDSGIVSSIDNVLVMRVLRGVRGLGLGFTNHVSTGGVLDVYLCLGCGVWAVSRGVWFGA